jgi:hypothetical protein
MENRLPDLEEEDRRYNLHVGAEPIEDYNITLIWPAWRPSATEMFGTPLLPPDMIKEQLAKLGVVF